MQLGRQVIQHHLRTDTTTGLLVRRAETTTRRVFGEAHATDLSGLQRDDPDCSKRGGAVLFHVSIREMS